jgi:1-aminocyclopropane-1-carboxylate deaminase
LSVLRLDKIHPFISGNKWFKLRFYLDEATQSGKKIIVTRGGAWSNHILATAAAANLHGLKSIGLIRGEEPPNGSAILNLAKEMGMDLRFQSRTEYREATVPDEYNSPGYYYINEGGFGILGAAGAATIFDYCKEANYSHICCAVGTGTMIAGLQKAGKTGQTLIGIPVLKHGNLDLEIRKLTATASARVRFLDNFHFGGYAKFTGELISFMNDLYRETAIPTDFVYTGKLFYAVRESIRQGFFPHDSNILIVHSGGLHGNLSLEKGTLIF